MDASCQCGKIKFTTLTSQPLVLSMCHCTECRKQSGSAFGASARFPYFELPKVLEADGLLKRYSRSTAGGVFHSYFCTNCGTTVMEVGPSDVTSNTVWIKAGCLDGPLNWKDADHIWCRSAVVDIPKDAKRRWEQASGVYEGWELSKEANRTVANA